MTDRESVSRRVVAGVPVLELRGDLDFTAVRGLRERLAAEITPSDRALVLDLSSTPYVDSAGVHLLVELAEGLAAHRQQLRLVLPPASPIRRVLLIAGVDRLMHVEDTIGAAIDGSSPA